MNFLDDSETSHQGIPLHERTDAFQLVVLVYVECFQRYARPLVLGGWLAKRKALQDRKFHFFIFYESRNCVTLHNNLNLSIKTRQRIAQFDITLTCDQKDASSMLSLPEWFLFCLLERYLTTNSRTYSGCLFGGEWSILCFFYWSFRN